MSSMTFAIIRLLSIFSRPKKFAPLSKKLVKPTCSKSISTRIQPVLILGLSLSMRATIKSFLELEISFFF